VSHNKTGRVVAEASVIDLGNVDEVELMLAGDQHIGDKQRDPRYMELIDEWVHGADNRYLGLTGDLFNAAIVGSKSDVYEETDTLEEATAFAVNWLKRLGDRIVFSVSGNHDQRVTSAVGLDPVANASSLAGVRYDGLEAYVTLKVGHWAYQSRGKRMPVSYMVYATHGVGGGRTDGAKLNSLTRLRDIVVADIYAQGHQHDPVIKPKVVTRWDPSGARIIRQDQLCIVTPGGLVRGGYAVAKAYAPTSVAIPVITLSGRDKHMTPRLETLDSKIGRAYNR
jgi:predicted phosphodiesterase